MFRQDDKLVMIGNAVFLRQSAFGGKFRNEKRTESCCFFNAKRCLSHDDNL